MKICENRIPSPDNYRKISKPLIEKKRRARINASLIELKGLLETVLGAEIPRDSKLEKADILEMVVTHLKRVHKQTVQGSPLGQYRSGYDECASETSRYLGAVHGLDTKLSTRLVNHLAGTLNQNTYNKQNTQLMTSQKDYVRRTNNRYGFKRQPITDINTNYVTYSQPIGNEITYDPNGHFQRQHQIVIKPEQPLWRPW